MMLNVARYTSVLRKISLATTTCLLAHCGLIPELSPDRSDETRLFLDKPTDFTQFKLKANTNPGGSDNDKDKEKSHKKEEESIDQAQQNGAKLLFRSSSNESTPKVQYTTKFLTENESIGELTSTSSGQPSLQDLVENNIVFPNHSDYGSYFFHRNAKIKGTSNLLFALPDTNLNQFNIDQAYWDQTKKSLQSQCTLPLIGLMFDIQIEFNFSEVSFKDFEIGSQLLNKDAQNAGLDSSQVKFSNLDKYVKEQIKNGFNPSITDGGKTVSFFMLCPTAESPKLWRINKKSHQVHGKLSNQGGLLNAVFKNMVSRQQLEQIKLSSSSLMNLVIKNANREVFTRDQYLEYLEVQIPAIELIVKALSQKKAEPNTTDQNSTAALTTEHNRPTNTTDLQDDPGHPTRSIRADGSFTPSNTNTSIYIEKPLETTREEVEITSGDTDDFQNMYSQIKQDWDPALFQTDTDPFFSTVLKRVSKVYFEQDGTYLPYGKSDHLIPEGTGFASPLGSIWNEKLFANAKGYNDAEVESLCKNAPFVRDLTINANTDPPREDKNSDYIAAHGWQKSITDVVLQELWVDANPKNKKYASENNATKNPNQTNAEKKQKKEEAFKDAKAAIAFLTFGAYGKRTDVGQDPLKEKQRMNIKICLNPDPNNLTYEIFWQSTGTNLQWNDNIKWDYMHVNKPKYIVDAVDHIRKGSTGPFSVKKTPLMRNLKPWRRASKKIHLDKSDDNYKNLATLVTQDQDPRLQQTLQNRAEKPPTQIKVVCSQKISKCFLLFQATFMRAMNPTMLSFYVTPPGHLPKELRDRVPPKYAPARMIYGSMLKQLITKYYADNKFHKSETTLFGALEIDDLDQQQKNAVFLSLDDLKRPVGKDKKPIFKPSDPELYNEGTVYFTGSTADLYLSIRAEDASGK